MTPLRRGIQGLAVVWDAGAVVCPQGRLGSRTRWRAVDSGVLLGATAAVSRFGAPFAGLGPSRYSGLGGWLRGFASLARCQVTSGGLGPAWCGPAQQMPLRLA